MSNITNLNRDYLIKINVKEATIDVPKMTFWNTDKKTSNMFVQLVINMSTNELISNYVTVQNATDYKITLNVIKPKTNQYKTIEATLLNEEKALFEIDLPDEYKDQVGNYNFEFEVSSKVDGNDESITTSNATYEVKGSILTNLNEETSSSPDLPILKQLIEQVKSLQGGDLTGYQKKSDNSLETTSKEVVGAINEVNSQYKEIAKQVGTETLNTTAQDLKGAINEVFQNVSNGKRLIASAITDKGVNTSDTATFQEMATNIGNISSTGGWSTQYSVTYKLSNVVSSNTSKSGNIGSSYTTTLTPNSGYKLNTPIITVDGIDVTSRYYLNGVFTINNVFGNIVITAHATKVITGEGLTLNYTFNNQTAGNGYGTISLLASSDDAAGTYAIQYADDNGALSNYDNICTLTVTNGVQADYNHFIKEQTIPKYATRLIAVKDNQTKAEFVIPESKRFTSGNYGRHLYSFGAISDLHTGVQTWDTDFQEALTYFNNKESALFTCITGDITDGGKAEQFQNYKNIKDTYSPNTPVYATNGNHEWNNSLFDDTLWDTYMNNKRTCLLTQGNDVFIMLGTGPKSNLITSEQKQWVELQLEKYSNCRVFILCHYFINGTDNGNYAKWDTDNVFSASNTHGQWLLGLLQQYKNAFYVSGHSHFKFILQELNPKANVCNEYNNNEIGYLWHLSSITIPRDVSNGSATGNLTAQSEGAVVDVYEKCILFRGRNFVDKKFLPIAQYIIPKIEGILPDINVYTVKTTMKNATSSNATTLVTKNSSYTTTITGTDGYSISKITVIMGMTDISSTAVSGNTITIESVTDDLFITVTTSAASSSEVITPTWMNGGVSSSGLDNDGDKDAMRSSYMEFDTTAYTYYITISDEFEGLDKVRLNVYNPDGSFNKRISYTSTSFTPGISGEIAFPITSGTFRFKVDFITSNTLENINDRLKITKVAK